MDPWESGRTDLPSFAFPQQPLCWGCLAQARDKLAVYGESFSLKREHVVTQSLEGNQGSRLKREATTLLVELLFCEVEHIFRKVHNTYLLLLADYCKLNIQVPLPLNHDTDSYSGSFLYLLVQSQPPLLLKSHRSSDLGH